uniref:Bifunctional UDP-N-acetylglucosamine transferase and deubiquitinase ALG13 n=1 Tax=Nicotiana sylvestris TaxID=4096 RepID=A0A1U7WFW1_NICSY|nr:PREDICTED: putative bifunctional UDP-N-acetylglucosamine transferase and deubiquitinase ALG13 [Nicotiana sylvestris]XP_009776142.1 PREDICTED: putative bifunctional UDP-N-acetylglucosamine transferase and deubiquitinase ALG13 [Nicotiana sylvestris]
MGETGGTVKEKKVVFVTVGTTCFDALVRAVDTPEVKKELFRKGYTNILIQIGRGSYIPTKSTVENGSAVLEYFTFSSSIADYFKEASLVISHAGIKDRLILLYLVNFVFCYFSYAFSSFPSLSPSVKTVRLLDIANALQLEAVILYFL